MTTTRIAVIARSLGLRNGGVYRYVFNVLKELDNAARDGAPLEISILHNEHALRSQFPHCVDVYTPGGHTYAHRALFDYVYSAYYLKKLRVDYVLYPKNIIPVTHYLLRAKKIVTILDLGHFEKALHAYRACDTLYARGLMKLSCRMADHILAISQSTKQELIRKLQIDARKIHVTHLGVEEKFHPREKNVAVIQKFHLQLPYVFFHGSITPRKNLQRTLDAFDALKDRIPHAFYITGAAQWGAEDIQARIKTRMSARAHILGYVEDDDLPALYSMADLLVYPSLHEGFGLPILEAQACGCPVLTSNVTACPEVAGTGAHFADPYSVEDIQAGMLKIIQDKTYQHTLIHLGFENSRRFPWKNTAQKILRIIDERHVSA